MSDTHTYSSSSDVAFTRAVKAIQTAKGSRDGYAQVEAHGGWRTEIDERLTTGSRGGQQPVFRDRQRRRPALYPASRRTEGLCQNPRQHTLAFADYSGNRQYITQGNLSENPKAHIFLMDYAHRRRVKIWGEARVVDDDPALLAIAEAQGYKARPEQVILFKIAAWDTNCPQHIPQKIRRCRRRSGAGGARCADRGVGGRAGGVEGSAGALRQVVWVASFRGASKMRTRNLEIPGSMLRIARNDGQSSRLPQRHPGEVG